MGFRTWLVTRLSSSDRHSGSLAFGTIRLVSKRELRGLFPEATIVGEGIGPFVKSWYVVN